MEIGIAIPTYSKHIIFLNTILNCLQQSTVLPKQVSISCSSCEQGLEINKKCYDFEIILFNTSDYKNPSQNRNIAASNLKTDIISFMDGDDFPHIQRNEFILNSFINHNSSCVVHDYFSSTSYNDGFIKTLYPHMDLKLNYIDFILSNGVATNKNLHLPYHNAHISVTKELYSTLKYDEDESLKYREDSFYTRSIVESGHKISLINNKLSQYNK